MKFFTIIFLALSIPTLAEPISSKSDLREAFLQSCLADKKSNTSMQDKVVRCQDFIEKLDDDRKYSALDIIIIAGAVNAENKEEQAKLLRIMTSEVLDQ